MDKLNYHHLRYFREVALEGNLTKVAQRVQLSQSALSAQIRTLEERLGYPLFDRVGRGLVLTEVGRIALDHANRIFTTGEELLATLNRTQTSRPPLRVGALATLSRNFQMQFLTPILRSGEFGVVLKAGSGAVLLDSLKSLALDVVLTTEPPSSDDAREFTTHRIAEQPVGIHGTSHRMQHQTLAELLANEPVILPTGSAIRSGFESLVARLGISPNIAADVDDMAMVRLLAREDVGLAIAPRVVLADEIASGMLTTASFELNIAERFYAVTAERSFPHPVLSDLLHS